MNRGKRATSADPARIGWNLELERALLANVLDGRHPEAWTTLREHCAGPTAFHERNHRLIALVVDGLSAAGKPIDAVSVGAAAGQVALEDALEALHGRKEARRLLEAADGALDGRSSVLDAVGGYSAIGDLAESHGHWSAFEANAKLLDDYHRQRRLIEALDDLAQRARTPEGSTKYRALVDEASNRLADVAGTSQGTGSIADGARRALARHDEAAARGDAVAATWGVKALDDGCILTAPRLIIVAARPGCGKTSMGLQAAEATRDRFGGEAVAIVSYEMGDDELAEILCGRAAGATRTEVIRGWMTAEKRAKFDAQIAKWDANNIAVKGHGSDDNIDVVVAWIRRLHRRRAGRLRLVVIDYLGLIPGTNPRASTNDRIGEVTRKLKLLMLELRLCILLLCQMNRASEREKRAPQLSDLRDSGNIEQDADGVVFLWSEEDDDRPVSLINVRVGKNRIGPKRTYGLEFMKAYGQRFRPIGGDNPVPRGTRMEHTAPNPAEDAFSDAPPTQQQEP